MFGSNVLDIAIGLAFLYLLLGLIVTTINELIESWLRKRAKDLEAGIREMFGGAAETRPWWQFWKKRLAVTADSDGDTSAKWLANLYNHPLVFSLFGGKYKKGSRSLPSYIPSRNFALALLDLVQPADSPPPAATPVGSPSGATRSTVAEPDEPQVVVTVQTGDAPTPTPAALPKPSDAGSIAILRQTVKNYKQGEEVLPAQVKKGLLALIDAAGSDMNQVRKNIEGWFDSTMDRVSGWYKRRVQWISGVVAVVLVVCLNADTFAVATALARDPVLRAAVTTAAEGHVKAEEKKKADAELVKKAEEKKTADAEAANKGKDAIKAEEKNETDEQKKAMKEKKDLEKKALEKDILKDVSKQVNEVQGFGWPLGWDFGDNRTIPVTPFEWWTCPNWRSVGAWVIKVLGWLLTAAAVSLGAPFWFDVLNRFIVIRSTVKPTEKSPNEPAVDRK